MILVTSDLQLSPNPRDEYRWRFLERTLPELLTDWLLILGDLCEEKDCHSSELVNRLVDNLVKLSQSTNIVILKGNHDYLGDPDTPFWRFLGHLPDITWINKQTEHPDILPRCLFLPYTKAWDEWTFKRKYDWVFAHQTFTGAITETGMRLEGVPISALPVGARVISGDIHKPQKVGPVTYVGSPYLCDFGDDFEPRVLLIDGDKIKSIPVQGPQKRLVEIKDGIVINDENLQLNSGDILKVRVHLEPGDHADWPELQAEVRKWGDTNGYVIFAVQPIMDQAGLASKVQRKASPARTDKQLLADYGKARQVPEATMKTGLFLMEKTK